MAPHELILPKLKNIQVISMSVTLGRYEVYSYQDKFTKKKVQAFLPKLEPFGQPFIKYSPDEANFGRSLAQEIEANLEDYLQQAFPYDLLSFSDPKKLTLGVASGPRLELNLNNSLALKYIPSGGVEVCPVNIAEAKSKLYLRPAQFYKLEKIIDLE